MTEDTPRATSSSLSTVPDWDARGFLPPFLGSPVAGEGRSPYRVGLVNLVLRFGDSPSRQVLLNGLLDYRAALHAAGCQSGFQWVDGSFVEDITQHDQREPNDVDIVTFLQVPDAQTQEQLFRHNPSLFDPARARDQYRVDAYTVVLDGHNLLYIVRMSAYWNALWSHNRNSHWKGYLEVDLADGEDAEARAALEAAAAQEMEE